MLKKISSGYVYKIKSILKISRGNAVIFAIVLLAFLLRAYKLSVLPFGVSASELALIKKTLTLQNSGDLWLGVYFKEGIYLYLLALASKIFGVKLIIFRLVSVIIGTASVFLIYLFTKEWFNRRTGYFAAALLAISSWHITLSRNIDPIILLPFILFLLMILATYAFRKKKSIYFLLSGFVLGLGLYINIAFLFAPILFGIATLYFYKKNKKFVTAYIKEFTIAIDVYVLISIPFAISFFKFHSDFLKDYYIKEISLWFGNFNLIIQTIFSRGEVNYFHNLGSEALLDPFIAILFLFGAVFALFHIKRRKNFFLVLLFFVMLLPGVFAKVTITDKIVGIIPSVFVLSAVTLDYIASHWLKTFPFNKMARSILLLGLVFFFSLSIIYTMNRYFIAYANADLVKATFNKNLDLLNE